MMVPTSEKVLPPLDLTGPASQFAERWRNWKRAFACFSFLTCTINEIQEGANIKYF